MTLSTDIVVCEPVNPERVFLHALSLLGRAVDFEPRWTHIPAGEGRGFSDGHYSSECGQGLPAWVFVHYADDAPLTYHDPDDYDDDPDWSPPWWDLHLLRIDFDTGYGWRGPNGARCGDLHAWLVLEMAAWLGEQGVTKVVWQNEFTGEWFSPDDLAALAHLGDFTIGALGGDR